MVHIPIDAQLYLFGSERMAQEPSVTTDPTIATPGCCSHVQDKIDGERGWEKKMAGPIP